MHGQTSAASDGASPGRARSRTNRREQLVCRALETLKERGETATVEDPAARMGVSKAARTAPATGAGCIVLWSATGSPRHWPSTGQP
jgi:hypothetical protein